MQIRFIHPPSSLDIQNAIHDWLELLARENYDEAYAYTSHDPYYEWTPELMKEVINGYGLPRENTKSTKYKVTDLKTALFDPAPRTPEITFYNNP